MSSDTRLCGIAADKGISDRILSVKGPLELKKKVEYWILYQAPSPYLHSPAPVVRSSPRIRRSAARRIIPIIPGYEMPAIAAIFAR